MDFQTKEKVKEIQNNNKKNDKKSNHIPKATALENNEEHKAKNFKTKKKEEKEIKRQIVYVAQEGPSIKIGKTEGGGEGEREISSISCRICINQLINPKCKQTRSTSIQTLKIA